MYEIQTENIFDDMWANKSAYDFSGFPKDSPYYSNENNKVLGKMKDEAAGKPILEFIGLRPKMYSFMIATDKLDATKLKEKHVAKGIQRAVIANLKHEDYRSQLDTPAENIQINRRIGTQLHQLYTFATKKRGLCAYDDKRYMVDNVNTLAYGHHRIPVPHVAIDMHPNGPVDAGMIVLAHQEGRRAKYKRAHQRIMRAAESVPQDGACAAPDVDVGILPPPPPKRGRAKKKPFMRAAWAPPQDAACAAPDSVDVDEPIQKRSAIASGAEQGRPDDVNIQTPETEQLNAQASQLLDNLSYITTLGDTIAEENLI